MNIQNIIDALSRAPQAKLAVFGDYALDKYLYIDPARDEPSAETAMPAYQVHRKFLSAGVGGTITNNLRALGAQVACVGVVGSDGEGWEILSCLRREGADVTHMVQTDRLCTCTYTKPMRKDAQGVYHELNRLDFRNFEEPPREVQQQMLQRLEEVLDWADGVIITDQFYQRNMGAVTDWLRAQLSELAAKRADKLFFADSRSFANEYRNMMVKCNNLEFFAMLGQKDADVEDLDAILAQGGALQRRNGRTLFVTRGAAGIVVFEEGCAPQQVPAFHVEGEVDIVGAGDATNAGIMLGLSLGLSAPEAALLACCISSITIQQIGTTGTAGTQQVKQRLATRL